LETEIEFLRSQLNALKQRELEEPKVNSAPLTVVRRQKPSWQEVERRAKEAIKNRYQVAEEDDEDAINQ
jgi:hypothetical protein